MDSQLLDDTGQKRLATMHKNLLIAVDKAPIGTEYRECYNLNMERLTPRSSVGEKPDRIRFPDFDEPHIAEHDHPNGQTFSMGDIHRVLERPNLQMLTAVGNDGSAYAIEKTDGVNQAKLLDRPFRVKKKYPEYKDHASDHVAMVLGFFEGAKEYGIQYQS